MASLATSAFGYHPGPALPAGCVSMGSPSSASPRTSPMRVTQVVVHPAVVMRTHSPGAAVRAHSPVAAVHVPRAPSPVSPVRAAAMQHMYAPLAYKPRPSLPKTMQTAHTQPQQVYMRQPQPKVASGPLSQTARNSNAHVVLRQVLDRRTPSPVLTRHETLMSTCPVWQSAPRQDSPPIGYNRSPSERTASPLTWRTGAQERVRPRDLSDTARALCKDTPQTSPPQSRRGEEWPDPFLMAHGSPIALAPTPDQPGPGPTPRLPCLARPDPTSGPSGPSGPNPSRERTQSVLESQPSITSSFLQENSPPSSPPQYTSAKLLRTSSSRRRNVSPGSMSGVLVVPPSPRDPNGAPRDPTERNQQQLLQDLRSKGAAASLGPSNTANVSIALFELFCAAVNEPSVLEQVSQDLHRRSQRRGELRWDDLAMMRPVQTLARMIACTLSGSGQLKEEAFWQILGKEEGYVAWWKALMARYGLHCSGDTLSSAELMDFLTCACRLLRDSFAPEAYLRNLRTVRCGAHRLRDRYENFGLLSYARFGRTYRCRGRLSFEDRQCFQLRKDRIHGPSDQVRSEAETLRTLQHPNLPRVVESFEDYNSVYIISELADSIRLLTFVRCRYESKTEITEAWLAQVLRQILDVLSYCHQLKPHSIVHGDFGMKSVGLASISDPATSPHVIIPDLGLAGVLSPPGNHVAKVTSAQHLRPEQDSYTRECCSPKQDVWACGCLLFILLSGCAPLKANDLSFGGPFTAPEASGHLRVDWSSLRHASAQAEALCSRMLESNPAQRPTAAECLRYPWLQETNFCKMVPLPVLDRLVKYDARVHESKETVASAISDLSSRSLTVGTGTFPRVALPSVPPGARPSDLEKIQLKPLLAAAPLLQLGLSVHSVERITSTFDLDGLGTVAHGSFVRRCMELAEDQVDAALWRIFVAADEDHRGLLGASKLEQVLDSWAACGAQDTEMEGSTREVLRAALNPELTGEAVREIAPAGGEVSFEALKEFVLRRHDEACAQSAKELGVDIEDGP
ncbi:unnamed protein product [Effrenium voratum]|nr:unnamed protein product [Effrenium voratum]